MDVNGDDGAKFIANLDKDGQNDLAIIYTNDDFNSAALIIFLSSSFKNEKTFQMCDWTHMIIDFYYEYGVLKLSAVDMGKFLTELELKYNPTTKNMVVYKYGEDDLTKKPPFQLKNNQIRVNPLFFFISIILLFGSWVLGFLGSWVLGFLF